MQNKEHTRFTRVVQKLRDEELANPDICGCHVYTPQEISRAFPGQVYPVASLPKWTSEDWTRRLIL